MRNLTIGFLAATALGCISSAQAADFADDYLRGPDYEPVTTRIIDWSGFYIGGHGGYTSAAMGFKNVYHDMLYNQIHDTTAETTFGLSSLLRAEPKRVDQVTYGIFAGYNFQFDNTVIGIEVDYTHFGGIGFTGDSQGRSKVLGDGTFETVEASGNSSTRLLDFGTIRGRAGYTFGDFLPFVTGGVAIGRAKITDSVSFRDYGFDQTSFQAGKSTYPTFGYAPGTFDYANPYAAVGAEQFIPIKSKIKTVGGFTLGGGLEYAVTSNILLRAEYQYVLLNDFDGHGLNMNTVRAGAAYKF